MAVLALDLGTTTGFCVGQSETLMISGTWDLKPRRYEGGGMRFVKFRAQLARVHEGVPVTAVYFEEVRRHKGTDAAHVYGGLMAVLQEWCEGLSIPYAAVPVGSIKRFATGKGNANKEAMVEAIRARGFEPVDDNEADAIALWLLKIAEGA